MKPVVCLRLVGIVFACFMGHNGVAQKQTFGLMHRLSQNTGLSENTTAYLYKDSRGFVWISSIDGLNRFDGIHVKVYKPNNQKNALYGHNIQSRFFENKKNGDLWFCTYEAINRYRRETDDFEYFQITNTATGEKYKSDYYAFYNDETQDSLWVKVGSEMYRFHTESHKQDKITKDIRCQKAIILKNAAGGVKRILSFDRGLDEINIGVPDKWCKKGLFMQANGQPRFFIFDIFVENDSIYWLATEKGLGHYNRFKQTLEMDERMGATHTLLWDEEKKSLLVSTNTGGILSYDINKKTYTRVFELHTETHPSFKNANYFYADAQGTWWFGVSGQGVGYLHSRKSKFDSYFSTQIKGTSFRNFFEDETGNTWLATTADGFTLFDSLNQKTKHYTIAPNKPKTHADNQILYAFSDNTGCIWAATMSGLARKTKQQTHFKIFNLPTQSIVVLYFCQLKDGRILCGNYYNGIYELKNPYTDSPNLVPFEDFLNYGKPVDFIYQDEDGNLYVSKNEESLLVYQYNNKKFQKIAELPIKGRVCGMLDDSKNKNIVWIGNSFGLIKLNKKKFEIEAVFNEEKGLPNQYIKALISDKDNRLWLNTNKGIISFNPQDSSAHTFTLADGLLAEQGMNYAFFKNKKGYYWFTNIGGVQGFDPTKLKFIGTKPQIKMTNIRINDSLRVFPFNISETQELPPLSYKDNTVTFEFVAMEYSDPTANKIKFKLEGYDKSWINCQNTEGVARYPKLPSGTYHFHIIAANSDEQWLSEQEASIFTITITPPFWERWWFRLFALALLGFSVWSIVHAYTKRKLREQALVLEKEKAILEKENIVLEKENIVLETDKKLLEKEKEKEKALQHERDRIAAEMHDDLGVGLSTIKIISEQLQEMPTITTQKTTLKKVEKITAQSFDLIEKMAIIIWAMNSRNDSLHQLIMKMRTEAHDWLEASNIACVFPVPHQLFDNYDMQKILIDGRKRQNVFLVFKEAIHNIIKHSEAQQTHIHIFFDHNILKIMIRQW